MKQGGNSSQLATKKDLLDLETRLEKRFEKKFATKIDLFAEMSQMEQRAKDRETEYHIVK